MRKAVLSLLAGLLLCGQTPLPGFPPGLFANQAAMGGCSFSTIDFTTGSLGTATLTRSSSATYVNISGVLSTATIDAARFNYDANYPRGDALPSLTGPFLLVEPAATNVALQSNGFNTTWFSTNSAVAVAAQFTSPDGTNNGWTLTSGTGFGSKGQAITFVAGSYTISAWIKASIGTGNFDLALPSGNDGGRTATTIERFTFSAVQTSQTNNAQIQVNAAAGTTLGIFGAQVETGTVATSYIVTTTGSVTRSADVVSFTQPSGCGHNTYTFDDNSTQVVSQAPGSATVPTNLTRPNIKKIDGSV